MLSRISGVVGGYFVPTPQARRVATTRRPASTNPRRLDHQEGDYSPDFVLLPGGELWWLGLSGSANASLIPVNRRNELTVYGQPFPPTPSDPGSTAIVMVSGGVDDVDDVDVGTRGRHGRRTARVSFTCDLCQTRNEGRLVNPKAFAKGSVFVTCVGCASCHKLVDNLDIFDETHPVFPPRETRDREWYAELQARIDQLKIDGEKNDGF